MNLESIFLGATFDDFLLRPQCGILETRKDADLTMPLTRNLQISLPVMAANMDTVTGAKMMKTTSLEGSFAFLHRNCPIETQAEMAKEVKRQHSYVIDNPSVIHADATIAQAIEMTRQRKISGLLVERTQDSGILAGILSRRNMERALAANDIYNDTVRTFMTPMPLTVASPGVPMSIAKKIMLDLNEISKGVMLEGVGSKRPMLLEITKGELTIDPAFIDPITGQTKKVIYWEFLSKYNPGIEVDIPIKEGDLLITNTKAGSDFKIRITLDLTNFLGRAQLMYNGNEEKKTIMGTYNLVIEHGYTTNEFLNIKEAV